MHSIKVLVTRSACVLAAWATCGLAAPEVSAAPAGGKDNSQLVRKAQRPAATKKSVTKKKAVVKKRGPAARKAAARKPRAATATTRKKPPVTARSTTRKAPTAVARSRQAAPVLPPPVAWTPPPLGPERFYPNGIPELRPEFLHPLADAPVRTEQAAAAASSGAEPNWLP